MFPQSNPARQESDLILRHPTAADGRNVHALVAQCPPLDHNSLYCNFLQCTHFARTSLLAESREGDCHGFIAGYRLPEDDQTLFIWQVAVAGASRRTGLGVRMLHVLADACEAPRTTRMLASINPENASARALFSTFARDRRANIHESVWLSAADHFGGTHPDEILLEIGPLEPLAEQRFRIPVHAPTWSNSGF